MLRSSSSIWAAVSDSPRYSGADGGFRLWNAPPGTARLHYAAPDWLVIDDEDGVAAATVELELGFTMLEAPHVPEVRLAPAMQAALAASALADEVVKK